MKGSIAVTLAEDRLPTHAAFPYRAKGHRVPNHNKAVSSPRDGSVQQLAIRQEAQVLLACNIPFCTIVGSHSADK